MKYRELIKNLEFEVIDEKEIFTKDIKFQYNPDRIKLYKQCILNQELDPLNIDNSPHVNLLDRYISDANLLNSNYYKMQKLYGKKDKWIKEKIDKFINLYLSIQDENNIDTIEVLEKPIVKNKYNSGYEIYEGHHRCSCYYLLGYQKIKCKILRIK